MHYRRIEIFIPSGPVKHESLEKGIEKLRSIAPGLWRAITPADDRNKATSPPFPWLHDSDAAQVEAFSALLKERECDIIWAARGGYGIMRWAGQVDWEKAAASSPLVAGFSDVTVLHAILNRQGLKSIHCPMPCTLENTSRSSIRHLEHALLKGQFPALKGRILLNGMNLKQSAVVAPVTGGNLCCLVHLIGTRLEPPWKDHILLVEDVNEPLYRIDRMLTQLVESGRLKSAAAVAAGTFSGSGASDSEIDALLSDRLGCLGIPVISRLPFGHGTDNLPVLLETPYRLDLEHACLEPLAALGHTRKTG